MKFSVDLMNCGRLILIGHDDCRWYLVQRFVQDPARLRQRIIEDQHRVQTAIAERFPNMRVEKYFARLEETRASFETV
jgi:hypothetical protein